MNRLSAAMLSVAALLIPLGAAGQIQFHVSDRLPANVLVHELDMTTSSLTDSLARVPFLLPTYFIYPDGPVNAEEALYLMRELGLEGELSRYTGSILVFNPAGGSDYDAATDFEVYKTVFNTRRAFVNLKIVGIGKGASFVDAVLAPVANEVAGIVSIGGKAPRRGTVPARVPVYVAGKNAAAVAKGYVSSDQGVIKESTKTLKLYVNASEPLLRVVVNTARGQSLREQFTDAWERLLSQNYRSSNYGHTNYMGGLLGQYGEYELEPYPMFDRLGIRREICVRQLMPSKQVRTNYLWYEYIPHAVETAAPGTVPLVVLLHGHNNDPRTQAEASGYLTLAADEGFMVAELEWQGKGDYNYMDDDGIEVTIRDILRRHPQVDPSRIYVEGMSAGGFAATALGIRKPYLFAAVGAHSGGMFTDKVNLGFPFQDNAGLKQEVQFLRGKITMPYFCISGTADEGVPFYNPAHPNGQLLVEAWKTYLYYGGFDVPDAVDADKYPVFGIPLSNRRRVETTKRHAMEIGDVLDAAGHPVMRLVAVENFGHANFVPGAREMWEFFRHWSRDPETSESVWDD